MRLWFVTTEVDKSTKMSQEPISILAASEYKNNLYLHTAYLFI
jgi:hypothetical protein